jgi:hypothetical protein
MRGGIPGFNKTEIDLMCPEMARWEAEMQRLVSALAVTATMLLLRIGGPRTSRDLPAASTFVPAWLGIDGALSMRHLCLRTFLLLTSLLPLSHLPAPA